MSQALKLLPLHALHEELGARFAPFAGYSMPVQYEGLIAEHNWTRAKAGLFDVSHMGPSFLTASEGGGEEAHRAVAALLEQLVPADLQGLQPGQIRYTTLLNAAGGVEDDLLIGREPSEDAHRQLYVVVNAGCKEQDFAAIEAAAGAAARLTRADDRVLLALQGPAAEAVVATIAPEAAHLRFMRFASFDTSAHGSLLISRTGYTGEDGFEILAPAANGEGLARALLAHPDVKPIGLGARDTLRLEAGLCLYGHDLDAMTSPIEAGLAWTIQKRRRKAADFPGGPRIMAEIAGGPARVRVGLMPLERAPAREGAEIVKDGLQIGRVTSGGFSPTLNAPISMGYVDAQHATLGTSVELIVRGVPRPAEVVALPFVPHRYKQDQSN